MHSLVATGQVTIIDANDGLHVRLSNQSHVVPTDASGANGNFTGCDTTLSVYLGDSDVSALWTVATATSGGITGSLSGNTYTVTALSQDTGYVDLTASKPGASSLTSRFVISKAKTGIRGSVTRYIPSTPVVQFPGPFQVIIQTWSDAAASASVPDGIPVEGDTVTASDGSTFVLTKTWASGAWTAPGTVIDGNLIVTNSITAAKINTRGLDIKDTAGNVRIKLDSNGQLVTYDKNGSPRISLTSGGNLVLEGDIYVKGNNVLSGEGNTYLQINGGRNVDIDDGARLTLYAQYHATRSGDAVMTSMVSGGEHSYFALGSPVSDAAYKDRILLDVANHGIFEVVASDTTHTGKITAASTVQATQLISTVATGAAPLTVASTTVVANLNADLLDGQHASAFASDADLLAIPLDGGNF